MPAIELVKIPAVRVGPPGVSTGSTADWAGSTAGLGGLDRMRSRQDSTARPPAGRIVRAAGPGRGGPGVRVASARASTVRPSLRRVRARCRRPGRAGRLRSDIEQHQRLQFRLRLSVRFGLDDGVDERQREPECEREGVGQPRRDQGHGQVRRQADGDDQGPLRGRQDPGHRAPRGHRHQDSGRRLRRRPVQRQQRSHRQGVPGDLLTEEERRVPARPGGAGLREGARRTTDRQSRAGGHAGRGRLRRDGRPGRHRRPGWGHPRVRHRHPGRFGGRPDGQTDHRAAACPRSPTPMASPRSRSRRPIRPKTWWPSR